MTAPAGRRRTGLLIPLFSAPSTASWGIGDIGDVAPLSGWLAGAGCRVLQVLPLNEMAPGQQSPYSALSAMAIDPLFIRLADVEEVRAAGGEAAMAYAARQMLECVRRSPRVDYAAARTLKHDALIEAFMRFHDAEWSRDSQRARTFREFVTRQAWWIEDYALFRAIHAREDERPWTEWPEALRRRDPPAIDRARRDLAREVVFYQYCSGSPRRSGRKRGGRRPPTASPSSGICRSWSTAIRLTSGPASINSGSTSRSACRPTPSAPPARIGGCRFIDGTSSPPTTSAGCAIARGAAADLYDGFRVDHLVGFYRTFGRPRDGGEGFFTPEGETDQIALGERVLAIFREPGAEIIAEDLGTVPDYVRESLRRVGIPGYRVFRWERRWHRDGQPFRDPVDYPAASVATTGTHDTEPMATWWDRADEDERRLVAEIPSVQRVIADIARRPFDADVRDGLLETLFASGSDLLLFPVQDVFGWRDRINEPAKVDDRNWTFQLPWPSDRLIEEPEAAAATARSKNAVGEIWPRIVRPD